MQDHCWKLTLVTNKSHSSLESYLEFIAVCGRAGITSLQLREKDLPYDELLNFGKSLKTLLDAMNIHLIVNDSVNLCLVLDAAGVHLGQSDGDVGAAREILGPEKIIGLSVNTLAQITAANTLPIDYVGVGALFPTKNKPDIETVWGLAGLKQASSISRYPIVAIGGIDERNAHLAIKCGAKGIAAISAFHDAVDPEITTQSLRKMVEGALSDDREN